MPPKRKAKESTSPSGLPLSRTRESPNPATIEQYLMEQNLKSKDFIRSFKEQVVRGRQRCHDALAELKQDLLLQTATSAAAAQPTVAASTRDNPLFEQTQYLLRLSRAVLACHRTADRDSRAEQELLALPRETWKQDEEGMRKLLGYGKAFGEKVVEGWIMPHCTAREGDGAAEEEEDYGEGSSEVENLAKGLFEWRKKGRGMLKVEVEESWGVAARKQMTALVGVVRTLRPKKTVKY
ncbi:hypothetical protein C7999DRAFT_14840 [Corynascus novoguineensis]|uniref:Uncharacterized protein n=1 Tax=Corynascus novoguineensis TaxID=1126955 RepID=A0AAN7CSB0_9PEZI|nr:hypothetical protein C7999DRAFT_14840 [Corynascus novoguineensis]